MIEVLLVFFVQAIFMFFLDNKYRFLTSNDVNKAMFYQGMIATMYVFVIPLIAKGTVYTSFAYIAGSVFGGYASHFMHWRKDEK